MLNKLFLEMIQYYAQDANRIQHFVKVHAFAKLIGEMEQLDREMLEILEAAAYVHDIGIKPAEEKYDSSNGKLQEQEGPAAAKEMLERLGFSEKLTERVCYLVGHHHTYAEIDGIDYQILVEADFLVNLYEDGLSRDTALSVYEKIFRTRSGKQICKTMFGLEKSLAERFEFRNIRQEEADQAVEIEEICFPPNEACSEKMMRERIAKAPELFLVAVDRETGKVAGFLNGLATNERKFRDEFFTDAGLYEPDGENIMLLGLDVLPQYRRQGLAREIMSRYLRREKEKNRKTVILTCLDSKVAMYEKMGFQNLGISGSTWGGEAWYEMEYVLEK